MIKQGWTVCLPFGGAKRYDFVIDCGDGILRRAQCKTGRLKNGTVVFNTCSVYNYTATRKNYRGQIDVFIVYCPINGKFYKVPVDEAGVTEMKLRIAPPPTKGNQKRIRWAEKYEF